MIRLILLALLGLVVLIVGARSLAPAADPPKVEPKAETGSTLTVKLRVPPDIEFAKVHQIMEKVRARGATKFSLRVSKDGEHISAEVEAEPRLASKRIAAAVEELLEGGIKKISVEVMK